ncbi:hypothetical protein GKZ68_01665 [Hymenobacter sp. BRD128]|uniref:hypothetical protein n=1 Tax=Hymenobacter sp. BRD128 TaxID=2675878 RepID=UPI0015637412|nr:hypothetical protein [Hymenobacter sp. BRD128]QKG55458.1 hypothetical protein GKZ68_01665 [Hymenobacter sp. BRD128]
MRLSLLPLLPAFALLAACSNSAPEQQATTKTETMADTANKVASGRPAVPATQADSAAPTTPRPAAARQAPDMANVQNVADYLAGLPPQAGTPLAELAAQPAWQAFAKDQDKSWAKYRTTHTDRMNHWAATQLDSVRQATSTLFYPFSGPDFLNAFTLFPTASTYVMFGLEPVGSVPSRENLENPAILPAIKKSLWSVLNFSFFRTNDMAVDLKSVNLDGAVPLIMLFAARTGNHLQSVQPVQLDAQGQLHAVTDTTRAPGSKAIQGAELKLQAADGTEKTVYYFSADLSDWKLSTKSAPLAYVRTLGPLTTYVKSATYLMHKTYFSKIRNLVLERSNYLLQDDSGIAMKYFPKDAWQFTYYGTYRRPINLFAKQYQPELTAAYHDSLRRARPLPFGTGYNWRQTDSNLLLAKRRAPISK